QHAAGVVGPGSPAHTHVAAGAPYRSDRSRSRLRRAVGDGRSPALPALLGKHGLRGQPRRREHVHPMRRLRGCVPGELLVARIPGSHPVRARCGAADSRESGIVWRGARRSRGRRTRHRDRVSHAERRDSLYSLRALRRALSRRHYHHGVIQPGFRRADGIDFGGSHRWTTQTQIAGYGWRPEVSVRGKPMSEEKKNTPAEHSSEQRSEPGNEFDRRAFFVKLGLGSLSIAAAGTAAFSYQFLSPNVLYEPSPIVNAGKPENYAVDSVTMDVNAGIYLIH